MTDEIDTSDKQPLGPLQREWVAKLRSGDYAQTTGYLHDKHGYCCLGVALEHVLGKKPEFIDEDNGVRRYHDPQIIVIDELPGDAVECLGLYSGCGTILPEYLTGDEQQRTEDMNSLAYLNDVGFSFSEIGDIIEANPKAVFKEPL